MTTSRRYLFGLLGLVLPLALAAAPASAASSTAVHKPHRHHVVSTSHRVVPHHRSAVRHVSHRTTRHVSHKVSAS